MKTNSRVAQDFMIENYFKVSKYKLLHSNSLDILKTLPNDFIDCVVTSPPYWKMREYDITNE